MDFIVVFDILGTLVFAISGALQANRHELDFLGFMVLAVATGVGGGMIRDVLLGATPPAVFQNELYLVVCLAGGVVVFLAAPPIACRWNRALVAALVLQFGTHLMFAIYEVAWSIYLIALGASLAWVGLSFMLLALGELISPLTGRLADRRGPLPLIVPGSLIAVLVAGAASA